MVANVEASIWERIVAPSWDALPAEAAEGILRLKYGQKDIDRMNELAEIARQGTLSVDQQRELDAYVRIGRMISVLQARARLALRSSSKRN